MGEAGGDNLNCQWVMTSGVRASVVPIDRLQFSGPNGRTLQDGSSVERMCEGACMEIETCRSIQYSADECELLGETDKELQAEGMLSRDGEWNVSIKYCEEMPDSASIPLIIGIAILALVILGLTLTAIKLYLARRKKGTSTGKVRETTVSTVDIGDIERGFRSPKSPRLIPPLLRSSDTPKKPLPAAPALHPREEIGRCTPPNTEPFDDSAIYKLYANPIKQNYEVERKKIQLKEKLGKGHFGTVYAADAESLPYCEDTSCTKVAVKTMNTTSAFTRKDIKDEFIYELEVMKIVNIKKHPNIIRLLGQVTLTDPKMLVLEYMENGNLQHYLRKTKTNKNIYSNLHGNSNILTSRNLLQFALDVARGMECVGELQLVHRDLAARNILIGENLVCKVADFGYAKDLVGDKVLTPTQQQRYKTVTRPRPIRWLPLESLLKFQHSIQSDVWSFGITMWEIITLGNLPYPKMSTKDIIDKLKGKYRMAKPDHCSDDFYSLMMRCWHADPLRRPTFTVLIKELTALMKSDHVFVDDMGEADYVEELPAVTDEAEMMFVSPM